jgi:Spy/CpxP family protein refolding chaperone
MNKSRNWIVAMGMAMAGTVGGWAQDFEWGERADMGYWAQDRDMDHIEYVGGPGGRWGHEGGGLGMGPMNPRILRELKLSPEQEKKFREQRLAFEKKKIQLHSDRALLELDLRNVLSMYPVNQPEAMKIGEKIADMERKATLLRVEGISQFLSGLTADQHRKLLEIQAEYRDRHRDGEGDGPGDGPGMDKGKDNEIH